MISKKIENALNAQINREFFSEYLYLSMEAYIRTKNLDGIANFFHVQTQEEHMHGMKMFNFLIDREGKESSSGLGVLIRARRHQNR